jgi:hypothetical protein
MLCTLLHMVLHHRNLCKPDLLQVPTAAQVPGRSAAPFVTPTQLSFRTPNFSGADGPRALFRTPFSPPNARVNSPAPLSLSVPCTPPKSEQFDSLLIYRNRLHPSRFHRFHSVCGFNIFLRRNSAKSLRNIKPSYTRRSETSDPRTGIYPTSGPWNQLSARDCNTENSHRHVCLFARRPGAPRFTIRPQHILGTRQAYRRHYGSEVRTLDGQW